MKIWWSHNNARGQQEVTLEAESVEDQSIIDFVGRAGEITDARQTLRQLRTVLEVMEGESIIERARNVMESLKLHNKPA